MAPEPLYPDQPVEGTDNHHIWWLWCGREINLMETDPTAYPAPVFAAILAHRDAISPEDLDAAAYLVWAVEEHPPWDGGCTTCDTPVPCPDLNRAHYIGTEVLVRKSWELIYRSRATIARIDQKRAAA